MTAESSVASWPRVPRARPAAPNVIFIVLDDLGFAQLGCYGSPIRTPNIDRLAAHGLLYSSMHATPLCSPTRSCILTGRNHHSNGMGTVVDHATGFPGYHGLIPFENGFLSEILVPNGYGTFAIGKWHLTPSELLSAAGPYDRWPLGRGFERFYGFWGAGTSQYYPHLVYDNHQVRPLRSPTEGYHLTEDLVDRAIEFTSDLKQGAPDKPFFLYFCTGAMHAPHQVPQSWIERYSGAFDDGWSAYRERTFARQLELGVVPAGTRLSSHNPDVPEWAALSPDERRVCARMMEVYAGFLEHTDHEIGRLVSFLESVGELENSLLMVMSDNGASAEGGPVGSTNEMRFSNRVPESLQDSLRSIDEIGGPRHWNHYPYGWAWAGDTPLRRWKRETYRGGVGVPFIVHWPAGLPAAGEVRHQFAHVIDIVPTVLDVLDIEPPSRIKGLAQSPLDGVSFAQTLADNAAPSRHTTQYFEGFGHRAIYHDGWRAVSPWPGPSFAEGAPFGTPIRDEDVRRLDSEGWELFHVASDFAETTDLARHEPARLRTMIDQWYVEAEKYHVLPLDSRNSERFLVKRPIGVEERVQYVYYPGTQLVPANAAVRVLNRSHRIDADLEVSPGHSDGVVLSHGGNTGGYVLFILNGRLEYVHNYVGATEFQLSADREVPLGRALVSYEFEATDGPDMPRGKGAPGRARLLINGVVTAERDIPVTVPVIFELGGGLEVGRSGGSPVSSRYEPPFAFAGRIHRVTVEVRGEDPRDLAGEAAADIRGQ